ncbi:MAG: hypothetical protein JW863_08995 [Chitinispirillaceae bacterium]|nr:hypothetical protein [Chitinispirillaceae bacterium]
MRNRFIISIALLIITAAAPRNATAQLDSCYRLLEAYTLDASEKYRTASTLFMDLSYTFCGGRADSTPVPEHVVRTDSLFTGPSRGEKSGRTTVFPLFMQSTKKITAERKSGRLQVAYTTSMTGNVFSKRSNWQVPTAPNCHGTILPIRSGVIPPGHSRMRKSRILPVR